MRRLRRLGGAAPPSSTTNTNTSTVESQSQSIETEEEKAALSIDMKNANFDGNKNLGESLILNAKSEEPIAPVEIVKMDTDDFESEREDSGVAESMETDNNVAKVDIPHELRMIAKRILSTTNFCTAKFESNSAEMWTLDEQISEHLTDIIEETLCGALNTSASGCEETPLKRQKQNSIDEAMDVEERKIENRCDAIFEYFNNCYTQAENEQSLHKRSELKEASNKLIDSIKDQLVRNTMRLLVGDFDEILPAEVVAHLNKNSPLLPLFAEHIINFGYATHLVSDSFNNEPQSFTKIFTTLLNNLFFDMQKAISGHVIDDAPLNILRDLVDIKLLPHCVERPICKLIVEHPNFFPKLCSEVPAREISRVTFLAPFLSISIFADENSKFVDYHFKDDIKNNEGVQKMFAETIQNVSFFFVQKN